MSRTIKQESLSRREPTMPVRAIKKAEPDLSCASCGRLAGCNCKPERMSQEDVDDALAARATELGLTYDQYLEMSDEELEVVVHRFDLKLWNQMVKQSR